MTDTMVFSLTAVAVLVVILAALRLRHASIQGLVFGLIGAIIGLLLGALASVPLSKLPGSAGNILPLSVTFALTIILMVIVFTRRSALLAMMPFLDPESSKAHHAAPAAQAGAPEPEAPAVASVEPMLPQILVDTSAIIDGRIADIAAAGFVPGRLTVPRFVLAELQNIADSDDAMRRGRGRRGLDVLNTLREMPDLEVTIIEDDVPAIREVDAKLVALAQRFSCNVLTTDYNLNRVAQIQGVRVLNVNELSNAIRPVVLPGEDLIVRVVQPGKERNQGVGYLADGTMIVVENGDKLIGQEIATEVTRVFQTVAGKMIFAVPRPGALGGTPVPHQSPATEEPIRPVPTSAGVTSSIATGPTEQASATRPVAAAKPAGEPGQGRNRNRNRNRGNGGSSNPGNANPVAGNAPKRPQQNTSGSDSAARIEERIVAATNAAAASEPRRHHDKPAEIKPKA